MFYEVRSSLPQGESYSMKTRSMTDRGPRRERKEKGVTTTAKNQGGRRGEERAPMGRGAGGGGVTEGRGLEKGLVEE